MFRIFALSFESEWRVPADLSGGMLLLLSDLLCLIYDKKRFLQFCLAFWLSVCGVTIPSIYFH